MPKDTLPICLQLYDLPVWPFPTKRYFPVSGTKNLLKLFQQVFVPLYI